MLGTLSRSLIWNRSISKPLRLQEDRPLGQQRGQQALHIAVYVKQGQRDIDTAAQLKAAVEAAGVGAAQEHVGGQHHPLGPAVGAGGVNDVAGLPGISGTGRGGPLRPRQQARPVQHPPQRGAVADDPAALVRLQQELGADVLQNAAALHRAQLRVDGDLHGAQAGERKGEQQVLRAVVQTDGHPAARPDAQRLERAGEAQRSPPDLVVGKSLISGQQQGLFLQLLRFFL